MTRSRQASAGGGAGTRPWSAPLTTAFPQVPGARPPRGPQAARRQPVNPWSSRNAKDEPKIPLTTWRWSRRRPFRRPGSGS